MIVDDTAEIPFDVGTKIEGINPIKKAVRRSKSRIIT